MNKGDTWKLCKNVTLMEYVGPVDLGSVPSPSLPPLQPSSLSLYEHKKHIPVGSKEITIDS